MRDRDSVYRKVNLDRAKAVTQTETVTGVGHGIASDTVLVSIASRHHLLLTTARLRCLAVPETVCGPMERPTGRFK